MQTPHQLFDMIEDRRSRLGLTQAELGTRAFGKADTSPFKNLKRGSVPSVERLAAIADAIGYQLYFGPPLETGPVEHVTLNGADYAHIPLHDAMLAAGAGCANGTEQVIDHLAFRRDWLTKVGVTASTARLARVQGDSMQSTLWAGDMILIDTNRNEPFIRTKDTMDQRRSPIYAMIDGGEARVKRIERPSPDQLLLVSDNPDYAPELRQGQDISNIQIIGKVVWWGHSAKE